jgi:two-component system chemotaxis sensor kinase CheA
MEVDFEAILATHVAETEERLFQMEEAIISLEGYPQDDEILESIFRHAHTIKGNSASLGLSLAAELAHAFEETLQHFRDRTLAITRERISLLLRAVDALRQITSQTVVGEQQLLPEHSALLQDLSSVQLLQFENDRLPDHSTDDVNHVDHRQEKTAPASEHQGTIRVNIQKLDRMINLAAEIGIAQGRLRQTLECGSGLGKGILQAQTQVEQLTIQLQDEIMKIRMMPLGPVFRRYNRVVRDIAQAYGKRACLEIAGEEVEIDVTVVEHLKDPVTHMIRNALDHGIESCEVRRNRGKEACGTVRLTAMRDGASVLIKVADDGAGLDRERIAARARALGRLSESENNLKDQELYQFIFEPGFSTAEKITELSGRGVGMDVVKRSIDALRGRVAIDSEPGKGTTITIQLPLTLAIIDGFSVGVGEETYVLPVQAVKECLEFPAEGRQHDMRPSLINLRGEPLPYVRLRDWFALKSERPARESLVVVELNGSKLGLTVDVLHGPRQTVIKPLGKPLHGLSGIAGSAVLGNGRVAMILDVPGLLREVMQTRADRSTQSNQPFRAFATNRVSTIGEAT